jgi:hypothetical protein
MPDMSALRKNMVQHQIAARGVSDERLLDAMKVVPREAFMPDALGEFACEDTPLPNRGRADDLAALHRRPHDRRHRTAAGCAGARDRHRLRVWRCGAVPRQTGMASTSRRRP